MDHPKKAELDATEERLVAAAVEAARGSYAPYSKIRVGAALLCRSGAVHTGANVENASFGLTICAERVAAAGAASAGDRDFTILAVASSDLERAVPCGACLQFLSEFSRDLTILIRSSSGEVERTSLGELLPRGFSI
jgi:cytidine deaminase